MSLQSLKTWADRHHPKWIDGVRILLGLILFIKGISFIVNKEVIAQLLLDNHLSFVPWMLMHYVIVFQITNGAIIAVGLVTRVACLIQIPTVLGAIVFISVRPEFSVFSSDVWLAVIILALLVLFVFYGSGPLSIDALLKNMRTEENAQANAHGA